MKLLSWPTIYFTPTLSQSLLQELAQIAKAHKGTVVSNLSEATHIIDWDEEVDGTLPQHLVEEFCRPVEIRPHEGDGIALVHWWYHPDSYDEWIPSHEVEPNDLPEDPVEMRPRVWKLSCRFIRDVEIFNEWGNELDYEIDDVDEDSHPSENPNGRKRKGRKSDEVRLKKKVDTLIVEAVSATEKMLQTLPPPTSDPSSSSTVTIVNINGPSQYELKTERNQNPLSMSTEETRKRPHSPAADSAGDVFKKRLYLDQQTRDENESGEAAGGVQYPVWYDRDRISSVEIRYLPEILHCDSFASSSSSQIPLVHTQTAQTYLSIRNFILDLYRQNPLVYLSATECRQKISGDVSRIIRIHEFLDVFGLINFSPQIKPHSRPPKSSSFYSSYPTQSEIVKHCETIRSLSDSQRLSSSSSSSGQCNGHGHNSTSSGDCWTPELERELIALIISQQSSASGSSGDVEIDWNLIATQISEKLGTTSVTAKDCFIHFVQLSLLETSLPSSSQNMAQMEVKSKYPLDSSSASGVLNLASSHLHTAGSGGRNSWGIPRKIRSVAALVVSECANQLDYQQARQAIHAVNEVYRVSQPLVDSALLSVLTSLAKNSTSAPVTMTGNQRMAITTLVGGSAVISRATEQALQSKAETVESLLDDYISTRLIALEEKVDPLSPPHLTHPVPPACCR
jgi:hypothetical protein